MIRILALLATLAIAFPSWAGEPVLVPDFTPDTTSEFALAFMLQDKVAAALEAEGHVVLTNKAVAPVVGETTLQACADTAGCPFAALRQLPVRVAVVARIDRSEGFLRAEVNLYEQSDSSPVVAKTFTIEPGKEGAFANEVAMMTTDMLSLLGAAPAAELKEAIKLLEAANAPPPPPPSPDPVPVPTPVPAGPAPEPAPLTIDERLKDTGVYRRHLVGSRLHFDKSELDPRDWVYKTFPHAGRVTVELRSGIGIGDVDRHADVRVRLDEQGATDEEWYQEGPIAGARVRGAFYAGYAPSSWVDIGVLVGLQYGFKELSTGWSAPGGGGETSSVEAVQALQTYVQPRVRLYMINLGPAKPFVFGGPEFRFFDKFDIIDPVNVDYPDPAGGMVPGLVAGGGLLIDPSPIFGFFFEGSFTQHFGLRARAAQLGPTPLDPPSSPLGQQHSIGVSGGVQFRI